MSEDQSSSLEIRETQRYGRGTYAKRPFKAGEFVVEFRGLHVTAEEFASGRYDEERCLQLSEDIYIVPQGGPEEFVNHSCAPNCGLVAEDNGLYLIAIRNIETGSEITFDYSTSTNLGDGWSMPCGCGAPECRKVIRDFDYLPAELKERYIALNVVPPHVRLNSRPDTHIGKVKA